MHSLSKLAQPNSNNFISQRPNYDPDCSSLTPMMRVCWFLRLQGGMRAVVWTDVFQCLAMFAGLLVIMIMVCLLLFKLIHDKCGRPIVQLL